MRTEVSFERKGRAFDDVIGLERNAEIDTRTQELILGGFTFDSQVFSLSERAQINWTGLRTMEDVLTWPVSITTMADSAYSLTQANLVPFLGTGLAVKQSHLDSGRALKIQINAAVDEAAIDAVIDTR